MGSLSYGAIGLQPPVLRGLPRLGASTVDASRQGGGLNSSVFVFVIFGSLVHTRELVETPLGRSLLALIVLLWLLASPDFIRYCFTHPMPAYKRALVALIYPALRRKIYQTYVVSPAKVERSMREFERALAEIGQRLDGERYLVGDRFTRADLSVAAMLSLLVMPPEHPFPSIAIPDSEAGAFYDAYRDQPVCGWVREMYRMHRRAVTADANRAGVVQGA
jgi:hypothetical protein